MGSFSNSMALLLPRCLAKKAVKSDVFLGYRTSGLCLESVKRSLNNVRIAAKIK